jgi:hypothetical protein
MRTRVRQNKTLGSLYEIYSESEPVTRQVAKAK